VQEIARSKPTIPPLWLIAQASLQLHWQIQLILSLILMMVSAAGSNPMITNGISGINISAFTVCLINGATVTCP
jgi:hypothetical protein